MFYGTKYQAIEKQHTSHTQKVKAVVNDKMSLCEQKKIRKLDGHHLLRGMILNPNDNYEVETKEQQIKCVVSPILEDGTCPNCQKHNSNERRGFHHQSKLQCIAR